MGMPSGSSARTAPGRACGTCTLCCKVYDVPATESPAGAWCRHCRPGQGCGVWPTRPDACREFFCNWITQEWLGPEWKPEHSKIVFTMDAKTGFLQFQVDPGSPNAWKRPPFYGHIKRWAVEALQRGRYTLIFVNKSATLVLPDREEALGALGPNDRLTVGAGADGRLAVEVRRG